MIDVDEGEIVELLQHEMRRVIIDRATLVALQRVEEALESGPVEYILAGVDFETDIDSHLVIGVEDGAPAPRQFFESRFDQTLRALRPGIGERPGERAREADARLKAEMLRGFGRHHELVDRPFLAFARASMHLGR